MKINRRHIGIFALVAIVIGFPLTLFGTILYRMAKHERWVEGRIEDFANYSYDEWLSLYDACKQLASESGEDQRGWGRKSDDWGDLPEAIRATDPMNVNASRAQVRLRFSGGHSRFVHILYDPNGGSPELYLYAEPMASGCVVPREDQRPLAIREVELKE